MVAVRGSEILVLCEAVQWYILPPTLTVQVLV